MGKFMTRRLLESLWILVGVVLITFLLMNIIPGNAATVLMGQKANAATYERLVANLGLDRPVSERFLDYIGGLLRGDLGESVIMNRSVGTIIGDALPNTLVLTLGALFFAWTTGMISGIVAAMNKDRLPDRILMSGSVLGISVPTFWLALILQYTFAYKLKLVPISGFGKVSQLILPSAVLGLSMSGSIARLLRANLLETFGAHYLDLARSKGVGRLRLLFHHALKPSMLPVLSVMIMQLTSLFGGAMITESIFGIPGVGTLSISALTNRDLPVLQGIILLGTIITIGGNLLADVLYSFLNPKIRLSGSD